MTLMVGFYLANMVAMVGWIELVASVYATTPEQQRRHDRWAAVRVPLLLAVVYAVLLVVCVVSVPLPDRLMSLPGIMSAFAHPQVALLGWVHYLVFDLKVGCWEVQDARQQGIPKALLLPCLFFTLMTGPLGWLLYWIVRTGWARRTL